MANRICDQYLETEVVTADPLELVRLLFRGAIDAVGAARRHMRAGRIAERSRQISKASAIVNELMQSLDRERGRELARNLAGLYDYIGRKLVEANVGQVEAPLTEAERLLATLAEAWEQQAPASKLTPHEDYAPVSCSS